MQLYTYIVFKASIFPETEGQQKIIFGRENDVLILLCKKSAPICFVIF